MATKFVFTCAPNFWLILHKYGKLFLINIKQKSRKENLDKLRLPKIVLEISPFIYLIKLNLVCYIYVKKQY